MKSFSELGRAATANGVLDAKTKELIAMALSVAARCDPCIGFHAKALVKLAPGELEMTEITFRDLPLYSYDYDSAFPPAANAFKDAIAKVDAVLFVTPEYNRSIPALLKNALDNGSRPYGQNA